jgi:2,4-dienoyl-CoA reductase-like NADH-dependent reductase (Old Yellow Enzyme family)
MGGVSVMMKLLQTYRLAGLELRNRIVRSATVENRSTESGEPTVALAEMYRELAEGGVGLIVTGGCYVQRHGRSLRYLTGIHSDAMVGPLSRLVEVVHGAGAKIAAQLYHAGRQTRTEVIGEVPLAPSPVVDTLTRVRPRAMTPAEIEETIEAFGLGAERAARAGFDAVEVLAGHGYLVNEFLSRRTNRRDDRWGGSLENRARFLLDIVAAVKRGMGRTLPLLVKINSEDHLPHGLTLEESCAVCEWLEQAGVDAIEVTGGTFESALDIARGGVPKKEVLAQLSGVQKTLVRLAIPLMRRRFAFEEAYFLENARKIRSHVDLPIILVGGLRDPVHMEKILAEGDADLLSLSRPFICEPDLVARWQRGDLRPTSCISCNRCFIDIATDRPVRCLASHLRPADGGIDIDRTPL